MKVVLEAVRVDNFNSRPSARGDNGGDFTLLELRIFQFTPLREGRPNMDSGWDFTALISIHAPPRGATLLTSKGMQEKLAISIHAPPRGATKRIACCRLTAYFNSRPSARGD